MASYQCPICDRKFANERGLKTHDRVHKSEVDKYDDDKYKAKRIANTRSVRAHRQKNPKIRFEVLEANIRETVREAVLMEKYMREKLGLEFATLKEKLGEYNNVEIGD